MCNNIQVCNTLARGNPVFYYRDEEGTLHIKNNEAGQVLVRLTHEQYVAVINYVSSQPFTRLGAGEADLDPDSLGTFIKREFNITKPIASRIAAVAFFEQQIDSEYLGGGANGGVRLYPAPDLFDSANDNILQNNVQPDFTADYLNNTANHAATRARQLATAVEQVELVSQEQWQISFNDIAEGNTDAIIEAIRNLENNNAGSAFIYQFSVDSQKSAEECWQNYTESKSEVVRTHAFARINLSQGQTPHQCLYVGSSRGLCARIRSHLGLGYSGTYALHMNAWCRNIPGNCQLTVMEFAQDIDQNVLQTIENEIWLHKRPMFGRLGHI